MYALCKHVFLFVRKHDVYFLALLVLISFTMNLNDHLITRLLFLLLFVSMAFDFFVMIFTHRLPKTQCKAPSANTTDWEDDGSNRHRNEAD